MPNHCSLEQQKNAENFTKKYEIMRHLGFAGYTEFVYFLKTMKN
jgi:hypothetical protein